MKLNLRLAAVVALLGVTTLVVMSTTNLGTVSDTKTFTVPAVPNRSPAVLKEATKKVVVYKTPDKTRTLLLSGEVGMNAVSLANSIVKMNLESDTKPIFLLIDSPGGGIIEGATLVSAVEGSKAPVYTVCLRLCASMAAIIHAYGTERYVLDRSILMYHPASGGAQGEIDKLVSRLGTIQRYVAKFDSYISHRASLEPKAFKDLTQFEFWVDAEDAVNQGFADKIVFLQVDMDAIKGASFKAFDATKGASTTEIKKFMTDFKWE